MTATDEEQPALEVLEPGLMSTIQDLGRPESTDLAVPVGGACDRWSLAVANVLVGNDVGAAAIEMTLVGPTLRVNRTTKIGLAGADLGGIVRTSGARLEPGRVHVLEAGMTIAFPGSESGGARAYLAIRGAFNVPLVLGSASTLVSAALGGIDGRPLVAGDRLSTRTAPGGGPRPGALDTRVWPVLPDDPLAEAGDGPKEIRVVGGPSPGIDDLAAGRWRVAAGSDRVGLRLDGAAIGGPGRGELLSHGVVDGALQLPPDGRPVVLLADHQTTGGYPVIGVVISADLPLLGQLRPGADVRFRRVELAEARAALIARDAAFRRATAAVREAGDWDDLWRSAGG
jgi:biotin-dependent carboxylase-like uncharacterized protein